MKRTILRKTAIAAALIGAAIVGTTALAAPIGEPALWTYYYLVQNPETNRCIVVNTKPTPDGVRAVAYESRALADRALAEAAAYEVPDCSIPNARSASMSDSNAVLDEAYSDYKDALVNIRTLSLAPAELKQASEALAQAEAAQARHADPAQVTQLASLARLRMAMAEEVGSRRGTEAEGAKAAALPQLGSRSQRVVDSGFDMGPAMMPGENGAFGLGTGMTDRDLAGADLNLTADQRVTIADIHTRVRLEQRGLVAKMQTLHSQISKQYASVPRDAAALSKTYRNMSELRQQMFDLSLGAQDEISALLAQAQHAALSNQ